MDKEKSDTLGTSDSGYGFNMSAYLGNVSSNLEAIIKKMGWTQKKLADEMDVAPSMMTEYVKKKRIPSLQAILRLVNNTEIQKKIPFTIDQFLTGDIRDGAVSYGNEFEWSQDDSIHQELLGTYFLYYFDQQMNDTDEYSKARSFRYGVLSIYESVKNNGGIRVLTFARFFKSEEEALAFRGELDVVAANGTEEHDGEITLYRKYDDTYSGSVVLIGNHIFIDLFSFFYNDKGLIILTAPEKKPGTDYIGGLGNIISVTHGAEHVPVSQKIILSRCVIEASDEEISHHLLNGNVSVDVDGETQALLNLLEALYSTKNGEMMINQYIDDADKRAILQQRLLQLIKNNINRSFNGLFIVTRQDDHSCYQFLKRYCSQRSNKEGE